jgi:hypothetical protein
VSLTLASMHFLTLCGIGVAYYSRTVVVVAVAVPTCKNDLDVLTFTCDPVSTRHAVRAKLTR